VDPVGFCETIAGFVDTRGFGRALGVVAGLASRVATAEEVVAAVGNVVTALRSVPAALTAFLRHPDSPPDAIRFAIELGGDADTIASMAGAAAGARGGRESLPGNWIDRLEDLPRLLAAGEGLRAR
jgi:poly(ADP-ribose) glycohydrolase ARH3